MSDTEITDKDGRKYERTGPDRQWDINVPTVTNCIAILSHICYTATECNIWEY